MSMNGKIKGFRGGNARNKRTTFPDVARRQAAAAARKAISDARTPEEQLKRLDAAGLTATRERAKLQLRIVTAGQAALKKAPAGAHPADVLPTDAKGRIVKNPR